MNKKKIIEELSSIKNIIKYTVPEPSKRKRDSKLSELEEEILKTKNKSKEPNNLEFFEQILFQLKNSKETKAVFSFEAERDKSNGEIANNPSYTIRYHENESEETLKFEAEDQGKKYSFEITREKPIPDKQPYELNIIYENKESQERLSINYSLRDYPAEREQALQDFTKQLDKTLHIMPKSMMGGILGYTYLGENFMARRDDLTGDKALMVDVHEAIHTPDEYETRVLTDWILARERPKYKR